MALQNLFIANFFSILPTHPGQKKLLAQEVRDS